jgi:uncharacterized protein (DUF1499 family)
MAISSASNNSTYVAPNGSMNKERSRSSNVERQQRSGKWTDILRRSDVSQLWSELHRLVCNHPLVRASRNAGLLVEDGGRGSAYTDLTQELFVTLLSKGRFQYYLDAEKTDAEIECEIGQIELTNILTTELRKHHPESYRLARRISTIIQSSHNFRRFDNNGGDDEENHKRLAERIYGLSEWALEKRRRPSHDLENRIHIIPVRQRDTRLVGCKGDSQIIISNSDLEGLIVSVLEACDSPVDMRTLRSLVMSRLPVMDIYLVPLGGDDEEESNWSKIEPVDERENPEEGVMRIESEKEAVNYVDRFLDLLQESVRGKSKQYGRILGVLWHCYLSPDHVTQLEAASRLGVSDSLVSDYRRRIEEQLRALSFTEVEEARQFESALRERIQALVKHGTGAALSLR